MWVTSLDPPPRLLESYRRLLSPREEARAAALASPVERRRWTAAHGVLACLSAGRAGAEPPSTGSEGGSGGLPVTSAHGLRFSLSHSSALALIAVGRLGRLGVDLELVRPLAALDALARRALTAAERAALDRVPPPDRPRAVLACWTRKEAYLKARGDGLRTDPREVEVGLPREFPPGAAVAPGAAQRDPAVAVRIRHRSRVLREWTLHDLEPAPGYVSAVAFQGEARPVIRIWGEPAGDLAFAEGWRAAGPPASPART